MPEGLLRKYRPVGPPPRLRARVLAPERRTWPRALAAAALLAITIASQVAARSSVSYVAMPAAGPLNFDARVSDLSNTLGGGEEGRQLAIWLVTAEEL